jgi:hypothetical protein
MLIRTGALKTPRSRSAPVVPAMPASSVGARGSVLFDGVSGYYSYTKTNSWNFADGNWHVAVLTRTDITRSDFNHYYVSAGGQGSPNNVQLALINNKWTAIVQGSSGSQVTLTQPGTQARDYLWSVVVLQRNGTTLEILQCPLGGTPVSLGSTTWATPTAITPTSAQPITVGTRSSSPSLRYCWNPLSWMIKGQGALSVAQIQALAAGQDPSTLGVTLDVYTRFDQAVATLVDSSGNGNTATRNGTVYPRGGAPFSGLPLTISNDNIQGRVYQRSVGFTHKQITFSGNYADSPTGIEARIVSGSGAGTEILPWTPCSIPAAGQWQVTFTVPQGKNYVLEVRHSDTPSRFQRSLHHFGVGIILLYTGQSNAANQFVSGQTAFVAPPSFMFDGAIYNPDFSGYQDLRFQGFLNGAGVLQVINNLATALNIPIGVVNGATSGSPLTVGTINWLNYTNLSSPYQKFKTGLQAVGGDCEGILWFQGEADADNNVSRTVYEAALPTVVTQMRSEVGRSSSDLPFFCWVLGRRLSTEQGTWAAIRGAHSNLIDSMPNTYPIGGAFDLPMTDTLHYNAVGYARLGNRASQALLNRVLPASYPTAMRGGRIASASFSGSVVTVTVNLITGTALQGATGNTGITGFLVKNGSGVAQTITSAAIVGANTVELTLASPPATGWTVEYLATSVLDVTNLLYTNAAVIGISDTQTLPVLPTFTAITL